MSPEEFARMKRAVATATAARSYAATRLEQTTRRAIADHAKTLETRLTRQREAAERDEARNARAIHPFPIIRETREADGHLFDRYMVLAL